MKTLHLLGTNSYLPWSIGGSIIWCHRLCQNLQSLGIEARVVIHQRSTGEETLGNHTYERVPVTVLPPVDNSNQRFQIFSRTTTTNPPQFRNFLAEYQPEIVHFHDFTATAGLAHMRLAKEAGAKVVMTYHTQGNSCSQHGLLYRSQMVCDGEIKIGRCSECRLSGAGIPPWLGSIFSLWSPNGLDIEDPSRLVRLLTTRKMTEIFWQSWQEMLGLVDALHVHAQWVKEIVELNGAPTHKVHFFGTGGPAAVESNSHQALKEGRLKVVFCGRSTWIKGIHVLVKAVQYLPDDFPIHVTLFRNNENWQENSYGQKLQSTIEKDSRFEIKYKVDNTKLLSILTTYDFAVVPSLWLETGPLTVLEAFAAGLPVIGSRLGGIAELVRDGVDGLLFEPGNAEELATILQRLYEETHLLAQLKKNVQPPRTMKDVAQDATQMYQKLLNE
jgi:glycosyltransferase involved in cell wall biosynthesis